MVDNEILEKKLSFERMYNYGKQEDAGIFLVKNPDMIEFMIKDYRAILKDFDKFHLGYFASVLRKLNYLEEFKND